eukprot:GHVU01078437.1.p2 GENE.GHVU01078437.1~~GHVU01078437.1.p2  ORF type:complete len:164 (-),score=12.92 GHVU01078437.1:850-1341(-)
MCVCLPLSSFPPSLHELPLSLSLSLSLSQNRDGPAKEQQSECGKQCDDGRPCGSGDSSNAIVYYANETTKLVVDRKLEDVPHQSEHLCVVWTHRRDADLRVHMCATISSPFSPSLSFPHFSLFTSFSWFSCFSSFCSFFRVFLFFVCIIFIIFLILVLLFDSS